MQKLRFHISDFAKGEELLAAKTGLGIVLLGIPMEGMGGHRGPPLKQTIKIIARRKKLW